MTRHGIGLTLALLALPADAEPQAAAGRFVMETHAVILPGLEHAQPATFMLNTINGDTWRVTDEGLKAVFPAPPVDEPDDWSRRSPQRFNEETEALLKPLRSIRIAELDFRQTDIRDVMDSLFQHQEDRISYIIRLDAAPATPPFSAHAVDSPVSAADPQGFGLGVDPFAVKELPPRLVSFSARDVTLREALLIAAELARLHISSLNGHLVLSGDPFAGQQLEWRTYQITDMPIRHLRLRSEDFSPDLLPPGPFAWKVALLADARAWGIELPGGNPFDFNFERGTVRVLNSVENHDLLEGMIKFIVSSPHNPGHPGRFKLVSDAATHSLLLVDSQFGHVWRYRAEAVSDGSDTVIRESFERLLERNTPFHRRGQP